MAKYLIHSCEKRYWYVRDYLVPSIVEQGIDKENILVYNDANKEGCLRSFISSAKMIESDSHGVWHIQDDVIISSDFKQITEEHDKGIACGFCSYYSENVPAGIRPVKDMWFSFPCIRIPSHIFKGFIEWVTSSEIQNKYRAYIKDNKFVDLLFRIYVTEKHGDMLINNLCPNIVDNVDYLLGGSTINYQRNKEPVSLYFEEQNLIVELKGKIQKSVYNCK